MVTEIKLEIGTATNKKTGKITEFKEDATGAIEIPSEIDGTPVTRW